ncbi:2-methylaconitate cis-trans isomerase PrpF family protein [Chloroflexota bacterium]
MEIQEAIRCAIWRGGTSRGIFFLRNDLPKDTRLREKIILRVFGAPDPREIDGLGGADMLTSKVAIIGPSTRKDCDVDYLFGQVSLEEPFVDVSGNCGNISSAVGPFAIDEGLVEPVEPMTTVRIHQVNTDVVMIAEVPVRNSRAEMEGDYRIDGVPGTGARIDVDFSGTGGATTGKLIPTGRVVDVLRIEGEGEFEVSMIDAANASVFIRAEDLGLTGTETPPCLRANEELLDKIETIRSHAAESMGYVDDWRKATKESPFLPSVSLCTRPKTYTVWTTGEEIDVDSIDIVGRLLQMQMVHNAYPVTGTVCMVAAAMIPGTIPNQLAREGFIEKEELRVGHPSGVIDVRGKVEQENGEYVLKKATVGRTARCIMKGYAFVPKDTLRE